MTTEEVGKEFVEHHGVKGMHWGVRKTDSYSKESVRAHRQAKRLARKNKKGDKKFEKSATSLDTWVKVHNAASTKFNNRVGALNDKWPDDFSHEPWNSPARWSPRFRQYMTDVEDLTRKTLQESVDELGTNPSGTRKVVLHIDEQNGGWHLTTENVKHADASVKIVPQFDSMGHVVAIKLVAGSMAQSAVGEEFILEHFGVKGMHWGVRREELRNSRLTKRGEKEAQRRADPNRAPAPVRVVDTIGSSSFTKTKLKVVGGEDHPAHEDAIKVAVSQQKLRKSGVHTLSNRELQEVAQRLNLESQVYGLQSKRKRSTGQGFVDNHLSRAKKDPVDTIMKTHKIYKTHAPSNVKRAVSTAAVAATVR